MAVTLLHRVTSASAGEFLHSGNTRITFTWTTIHFFCCCCCLFFVDFEGSASKSLLWQCCNSSVYAPWTRKLKNLRYVTLSWWSGRKFLKAFMWHLLLCVFYLFVRFVCVTGVWLPFTLFFSLRFSDLRAASWKNVLHFQSSQFHNSVLLCWVHFFLFAVWKWCKTNSTELFGRFGWCKQEVQLCVSGVGELAVGLHLEVSCFHLFRQLKILHDTHGCTHCINFRIQKPTWWFSERPGVTMGNALVSAIYQIKPQSSTIKHKTRSFFYSNWSLKPLRIKYQYQSWL